MAKHTRAALRSPLVFAGPRRLGNWNPSTSPGPDPMHAAFAAPGAVSAIPIWFVTGATWPALRVALEPGARAFVDAAAFEPKPGRHLLLPGKADGLGGVLFG